MKLPNTIIASSESCEVLHSSIIWLSQDSEFMMESQKRNNLWGLLQGQGGRGRRQQLQDILRVPHLQGGRGQGEADQSEPSISVWQPIRARYL